VQESDIQDDVTHAMFLHYMEMLGCDQGIGGMMVISHLDFKNYCDATEEASFRKTDQLEQSLRRGEFDVFIIHPKCGLIVVEIKSVGIRQYDTEAKLIQAVKDKIEKAVEQFQKQKKFLDHILKNDPLRASEMRQVPRTMTLVLPNLTRGQLSKTLEANGELAQV
jgi:Holliday junction resolvase-like predicted endonuclease